MQKIRQTIENNPVLSMVVGGIAGLAFPYGNAVPDWTVVILLAILIFLSCFKITVRPHTVISWKPVLFCFLRFAVLPVILWFACKSVLPVYATGILLLALSPAGVSSSGLTGMYNGNVTLAFVITLISNLACVVFIPGEVGLLVHSSIALPVLSLLETILLCIVLPALVYIPLRRKKLLVEFSKNHGRLTMVLLFSLFIFAALAKRRNYFLSSPQEMIVPLLLCVGFYAIAIVCGFAVKAAKPERIAYGACSAFNNNGLCIGLALLYFDEKAIAVMIASEVIWSVLPAFVQPIIRRLPK